MSGSTGCVCSCHVYRSCKLQACLSLMFDLALCCLSIIVFFWESIAYNIYPPQTNTLAVVNESLSGNFVCNR